MSTTNKNIKFRVVIPARLKSTRLASKLLLDIHGKSLIQHVYENVVQSKAEQIVVATDSEEIADCIKACGGQICMTSPYCQSGSERIAEAVKHLDWDDATLIVNVQGDELFVNYKDVEAVSSMLFENNADMATLALTLKPTDRNNPDVVKVVRDKRKIAMYFSRIIVNSYKNTFNYLHHIGIYAYRASYLKYFTSLPCLQAENIESLEQIRALFYGHRIYVGDAISEKLLAIDNPADLENARAILKGK